MNITFNVIKLSYHNKQHIPLAFLYWGTDWIQKHYYGVFGTIIFVCELYQFINLIYFSSAIWCLKPAP